MKPCRRSGIADHSRRLSRTGSIALVAHGCWRIAAATIPLMLLIATLSSAEDDTIDIVGLGAVTCAEFVDQAGRDPSSKKDYLAWAQGFMSAILMTRPHGTDQGLNLTPTTFPLEAQVAYLLDRCRGTPKSTFADAVEDLYKRLRQEGRT